MAWAKTVMAEMVRSGQILNTFESRVTNCERKRRQE